MTSVNRSEASCRSVVGMEGGGTQDVARSDALESPSAEASSLGGSCMLAEALAKLVLASVVQQRQGAQATKQMEREQQYAQEAEQVHAMRERASSIRTGGAVSSLVVVAAGAGGCVAPLLHDAKASRICDGASQAVMRLSDPLEKWIGDAPGALHEADAKQAELAAQHARDRASDSQEAVNEFGAFAQDALQAIKSFQSTRDDAIQTILRRM